MPHYLNHFNTAYIEELLSAYRDDPESLDSSWRFFFDGMSLSGKSGLGRETPSFPIQDLEFEMKVIEMIQGYRDMAYLIADVNPLKRGPRQHPLLELKNFGLTEDDLDKKTRLGKLLGLSDAPLRDVISTLKTLYCSPASVEIGHIEDPKSRHWVQTLVESKFLLKPLDERYKKRALEKLTEAETFERFIHRRFVGQKRFSLEGNDVLIPMLDYLIEQATLIGVDEIIIGMAHRGRLNVLANIFQKDVRSMFAEFSGNLDTDVVPGDGDVKYHMGYSIDVKSFSGKDVHISLAPNPSHLEAVNSVVMGMARSKQKIKGDAERAKTIVVLLHGDASFAGQGSVYEALNMSGLDGYTIGGAIHIIVNNQVGFTTDPKDSRSTAHATDVAKMLQVPIFRVNADEPDAALRCVDLAVQYRNGFKRDVVIDLVGYRRFGHNEGDEPTFTQPLMYAQIAPHPTARELYAKSLDAVGLVAEGESDALVDEMIRRYDAALEQSKKSKYSPKMAAFGKRWTGFEGTPHHEKFFEPQATPVSADKLKDIGRALLEIPLGFHVHSKVTRLLADRKDMVEGSRGIDWGMGEALAFGSLLRDGHAVRLAGQDAKRGTFSHRHAVLFDVETGAEYVPLNRFKDGVTDFEVHNSFLSEYAALGFEVGQSWANPYKLTLWEAQFGDFVNGAQIIIDQFLTCSAFKWQRYSGLVLLLPHGYEGQGPEHSSGRVERFLQACAQNNIQVCNLTTPAQYFHALRRQMARNFRLPLVIMTPKSLLRHPQAVSSFSDFAERGFHEIIDDAFFPAEGGAGLKGSVKRVVLCSGKIYYELAKAREKSGTNDVAIVRLEQFYPFPQNILERTLKTYENLEDLVWCQEEPQNMGGWWFLCQHLGTHFGKIKVRYAGRPEQASPAHGYMHIHQNEQEKICANALGLI
jgi:2-oxoglutarate dehydrogenase E1 component